jgi:pimeloyl-ACP methyl ester carboxylesterase
VTVGGVTYQIYCESAGSGQDVLCMHTAGADGRLFHGLMADPHIVEHHRLISFDLPWHGKSPPPEGAIQGSWRLNTDLYVALIMGFIAAAGLQKPVALGASMSGEICLVLACRDPDSFAGIIACEACDDRNARFSQSARDPRRRRRSHWYFDKHRAFGATTPVVTALGGGGVEAPSGCRLWTLPTCRAHNRASRFRCPWGIRRALIKASRNARFLPIEPILRQPGNGCSGAS